MKASIQDPYGGTLPSDTSPLTGLLSIHPCQKTPGTLFIDGVSASCVFCRAEIPLCGGKTLYCSVTSAGTASANINFPITTYGRLKEGKTRNDPSSWLLRRKGPPTATYENNPGTTILQSRERSQRGVRLSANLTRPIKWVEYPLRQSWYTSMKITWRR